MVRLLLAAAVLFSSVAAANAQFKNGNDLYDDCQGSRAVALGYVMGSMDFDIWETIVVPLDRVAAGADFIEKEQFMCVPPGVTAAQAVDVVCKHLEENPATRHYPAAFHIRSSLISAWPCR